MITHPHLPTEPVTHVLLAALAARAGDCADARAHLDAARTSSRMAARRERQLVEICSLAVAGEAERAVDLAMEHRADFPADDALLDVVVSPARR